MTDTNATDNTYQGWVNRATWAMSLNLSNDQFLYDSLEQAARYAAIGNEPDYDGGPFGRTATECEENFREELATAIERFARGHIEWLPDFQGDDPDDISEVNWADIAEGYTLADYL